MMDLSYINTDNIFKFMTTAGLLAVLFSVLYPLEKKQALELELNTQMMEDSILTLKIIRLNKEYIRIKRRQNEIDSTLKDKKNKLSKDNIIKMLLQQNEYISDLSKSEIELRSEEIKSHFNKNKLLTLDNQRSEYDNYACWGKGIGIAFAAIGFIFWLITTVCLKDKSK